MTQSTIINAYFEWMCSLVCGKRFAHDISFRKLLRHLHDTEFIYIISRDANRAGDGMDLRYRFAYENQDLLDAERYLSGPCSVLEMMVALAIRCEETIMDDPGVGNRTSQWFWNMITNLGLGAMDNDRYDGKYVADILNRFMNREYDYDGRGGLFTIRRCAYDLREVEIWYQMCWYLDSITR